MDIVEKIKSSYRRACLADDAKSGKTPRRRRSYDAARIDRLSNGFLAPISTGDSEIQAALSVLRARSRELERNNDYAKKFLHMCKVNVVGKTGFTLQNKARDPNGTLDKLANTIIENEWAQWGKKGNCTVDGRHSWLSEQQLMINTVARDGEFLCRKVRGFKNPWRFALQNLEADLLNEHYNVKKSERQNEIRMGIEYDAWQRPVAYHLRKKHPGESGFPFGGTEYERVPAAEIIHCFISDRPTQSRGVPWMHTAARRLNQVGEYEYAEVVAARIGSSKMGFYEQTDSMIPGMETFGDTEDEEGNPIAEAEAGIFEKLPPGYKFTPFLPDHPTTQFGSFVKASLRGVASGLGVSYNSLANDLEGVNFSSMRSGAIEERDGWKTLQQWMIDDFVLQVFEPWLEMLLLTDRTFLPYAKYDKFNAPEFRGRIFDWVDPSKDIDGEIKLVKAGWKTNRQVISERMNMDLEDVYEQLSEEKKLAEQYGLNLDLAAVAKTQAVPKPAEGKAEEDDDE